MKILNLYAGIGGNRKMWGGQHLITAIEYDENIAKIYKENFPNDEVIVTDAHQYLLDHFREYDFIWASPPCPSHSKVRKQLAIKKKKDGTTFEQNKPIYPDMRLYEEIIFLDGYFDGYYCVENVIPYYEPLIEPQKIGRHCFWANFDIPNKKFESRGSFDTGKGLAEKLGYDISNWKGIKDKRLLLRNCVEPEIGEYILKCLEEEKNENSNKQE
jgi:DNA (cytosine-5)-methyltransferase 1